MMSEIMVPVDSRCIPDGWEPLRFGIPEEGEFIIPLLQWGGVPVRVQPKEFFSTPRLIIRKKYNPGVKITQGWWVWTDGEDWGASKKPGEWEDAICGLQNLPEFIPTPDGQPRQIK